MRFSRRLIGLNRSDITSLCTWAVSKALLVSPYDIQLTCLGELAHLLLTPFPSGHTLGGTLFKIRSPTSGTVLYAVGMNHTGERHLDGMVGGELNCPCIFLADPRVQAKVDHPDMKKASCVQICSLWKAEGVWW